MGALGGGAISYERGTPVALHDLLVHHPLTLEPHLEGNPVTCGKTVVNLYDQLLDRNVQRFRGGLVFKAHRLLYHSTSGLRVIEKKRKQISHLNQSLGKTYPVSGDGVKFDPQEVLARS